MSTYEVIAHDFEDELVALVRHLPNRRVAAMEAARLFARPDVNRVSVTEERETETTQAGNGRYR